MLGNKSASTVNRFENGERPPSIEQLIELDAVIDLDLPKMFRDLTSDEEPADETELRVERELLLHLIRERADEVKDPVLSKLIINSIHLLDADSLKSLLDEMRRNRRGAEEPA